jgi:hypothetical protein
MHTYILELHVKLQTVGKDYVGCRHVKLQLQFSCAANYDRCKRQTRPLVREGALHRQNCNWLTVPKIWPWAPDMA